MIRRSSRLESDGYYGTDGEPVVNYKDSIGSRGFNKRRKFGSRNSSSSGRGFWTSDPTSELTWILPVCFVITLCVACHTLDLGPFAHSFTNKDLKSLRELQDEVQSLKKKLSYLIPDSHPLPNFALHSLGARVLCHLSSKTYKHEEDWSLLAKAIWKADTVHPATVIQEHSPMVPGSCWPFAGGSGHLSIALSLPAHVSHVSLGHISKDLSPTGTISSAPREFTVYGMQSLDEEATPLGTFLYDKDGDPVQTFKLPDHAAGVFRYVTLQVKSNWGHPDYSCLYSFRVHGKLAGGGGQE